MNALGPSVAALGGGHGLATTLGAVRQYAQSIVGVVSVGDDGGSSGRLRDELHVAPPGDVRRCLSALATRDSLLARSLEHRFDSGTLQGHPIGNLLLTGLAMVSGELQDAIDEVGALLGAAGRIVPATTQPVTLVADSDAGVLTGQVTIERSTGITNLRFDPIEPTASPLAIAAVEQADQIIIGPGSLFTSVLATAVVPEILDALRRSNGQKVFVANIANDKAEARGFGLAEHLDAIVDHGVTVDAVVAQTGSAAGAVDRTTVPIITADLAHNDGWSHDPTKLGAVLADLRGDRLNVPV